MKKIKIKKILIASGLTLAALTTALVPICLTISNTNFYQILKNNENNSNKYLNSNLPSNSSEKQVLFNGKLYSDYESAAEDYIISNKAITKDLYIGDWTLSDVDSSITNIKNDNEKLRKYDLSKISPAYRLNSGKYTENAEKAKQALMFSTTKIMYSDLNGGFFNTQNEAQESINSKINPLSMGYYEINSSANEKFKFNPLNKNDVIKFGDFLMNNVDEYSQNISFGIYNLCHDLSNKNYWFEKLDNEKEEDHEIILQRQANYLVDFYLRTKKEFLDSITFYVDVTLKGIDKNWKSDTQFSDRYYFKLFAGNGNNTLSSNRKTITFKNLKYNDLIQFNRFLDRDNFVNNHILDTLTYEAWDKGALFKNKVAETAKTKEPFFGSNYEICFQTQHSDCKGNKGQDTKILSPGNWAKNEAFFDVKVYLNPNKINNIISSFNNFLSEKIKDLKIKSPEKTIDFLKNKAIDIYWPIITKFEDINSYFQKLFFKSNVFVYSKYKNYDKDIDKYEKYHNFKYNYGSKNINPFPSILGANLLINENDQSKFTERFMEYIDQKNINWFDNILNQNEMLFPNAYYHFINPTRYLSKNIALNHFISIANEFKNKINIESRNIQEIYGFDLTDKKNQTIVVTDYSKKMLNKTYKIYLEYNNVPVFDVSSLPWNQYDNNQNKNNFLLLDGNPLIINLDNNDAIKNIKFPSWNCKFNYQKIKQKYKEIADKSSHIVNISNNVSFKKNQFGYYKTIVKVDNNYQYNSKDCLKYNLDNKTGLFKLNKDVTLPNLDNNYDYNIEAIMNKYNYDLKKLGNNHSIKNKVNNSQDILVLYKLNDNLRNESPLLNIKYREYLGDNSTFNSEIYKKEISLYKTEDEITNAINMKKILEPAIICIFKGSEGEILNPGVEITHDQQILLKESDGAYDPESIIEKNIFYSKILQNDKNVVMYNDEDLHKFIPLNNQTRMVYIVRLDKTIRYFPSFESAKEGVVNYIKNNSILVSN